MTSKPEQAMRRNIVGQQRKYEAWSKRADAGKFARKYDYAEKCPLILKYLSAGGVPFLSIAAARAGVPKGAATTWVHTGLDKNHAELTPFALEVRRIQSEWQAIALDRIANYNLSQPKQKALSWLLERLDRETFDPPKQIAEVVPYQAPQELDLDALPEPTQTPAQLEAFLAGTDNPGEIQ